MKKDSRSAALILLLPLVFLSCRIQSGDQPATTGTGFKTCLDQAEWITDNSDLPQIDSLFYGDHPAPVLCTEFDVSRPVRKAEILITAAGYYETWLNGNRIGDMHLDPAWTDFSKRNYITRLDVTKEVRQGMNNWGIALGNGFYNPLPLRMWGNLNLRSHVPLGKPCVKAVLIAILDNGRRIAIPTNENWIGKPGPVIRNNVYLGEWYDARREIPGWSRRDKSETGWQPVLEVEGPGGQLIESFFPPIRITSVIDPVSISRTVDSGILVDFGQNFAGVIKLRINASSGDTIKIRYGELLYPDGSLNPMTAVCGQIKRPGTGGPGAPPLAEQMDVYMASGTGNELFQPRFTFHGFRYAEIQGLDYLPDSTDIQGCRMNSDVSPAGTISSSMDYLDQLNRNCQWTFLSNLFNVQSDCPAREKFGYGGDINATAEAYIYNYDMHQIYRKAVYDWADAIRPDKFVDTAPFIGLSYCGISWESAYILLQYWLLLHYGDLDIVKELYQKDLEWMDKTARLNPGLIVQNGLSDHESLERVPVQLTGTCHYLQTARIMAHFAGKLDIQDDSLRFSRLAEDIRQKIADEFWFSPGITVPNRQTLLSCLIYFDILPPDQEKIATEQLLKVLMDASYHVSTGIFGTKYLLDALSSTGHSDIAFKVVMQPGYPGWKHMIDQGATTIWETWKESNNTFSQNHPMFGSVSEWYHKWLGGIQPDPVDPGSGGIYLMPQQLKDLDYVKASKNLPEGVITSEWKRDDRKIHFFFDLPADLPVRWLSPSGIKNLDLLECPEQWQKPGSFNQEAITLNKKGKYHFAGILSDE
jgi:alpha-L-rhamnosidase